MDRNVAVTATIVTTNGGSSGPKRTCLVVAIVAASVAAVAVERVTLGGLDSLDEMLHGYIVQGWIFHGWR